MEAAVKLIRITVKTGHIHQPKVDLHDLHWAPLPFSCSEDRSMASFITCRPSLCRVLLIYHSGLCRILILVVVDALHPSFAKCVITVAYLLLTTWTGSLAPMGWWSVSPRSDSLFPSCSSSARTQAFNSWTQRSQVNAAKAHPEVLQSSHKIRASSQARRQCQISGRDHVESWKGCYNLHLRNYHS